MNFTEQITAVADAVARARREGFAEGRESMREEFESLGRDVEAHKIRADEAIERASEVLGELQSRLDELFRIGGQLDMLFPTNPEEGGA